MNVTRRTFLKLPALVTPGLFLDGGGGFFAPLVLSRGLPPGEVLGASPGFGDGPPDAPRAWAWSFLVGDAAGFCVRFFALAGGEVELRMRFGLGCTALPSFLFDSGWAQCRAEPGCNDWWPQALRPANGPACEVLVEARGATAVLLEPELIMMQKETGGTKRETFVVRQHEH